MAIPSILSTRLLSCLSCSLILISHGTSILKHLTNNATGVKRRRKNIWNVQLVRPETSFVIVSCRMSRLSQPSSCKSIQTTFPRISQDLNFQQRTQFRYVWQKSQKNIWEVYQVRLHSSFILLSCRVTWLSQKKCAMSLQTITFAVAVAIRSCQFSITHPSQRVTKSCRKEFRTNSQYGRMPISVERPAVQLEHFLVGIEALSRSSSNSKPVVSLWSLSTLYDCKAMTFVPANACIGRALAQTTAGRGRAMMMMHG